MKKYIVGGLIGFMLSLGVSAHAEVSNLIDQVVQGMFPVTVNGQALGDAIVVDNKTYLPVREFGEAIGYTVTFTEDRKVVLTNKDVKPSPSPTTSPEPTPAMTKEQKIQQIQGRMEFLKSRIDIDKNAIEMYKDTPDLPMVISWKETVTKNEKELVGLQTQLDALLAQ